MYKHITIIFTLLLFATTSFSQNWLTDINEAKAAAAADNKPIIMVFQGSDWCAPCIKLERDVWSSEEFIDYSNKNYVLLQVDFPNKKRNSLSKDLKEHNAGLAKKYNKTGAFPLIVLLNADGEVLGKTGFKKYTTKEFIAYFGTIIKEG